MTQQRWTAVDDYLTDLVVRPGEALVAAQESAATAGLPAIAVAPNQGKLLQLLARLAGARAILEIGTLAGYSTIWLAGALPDGGSLVTLEIDPRHAEVAIANIERAGLADRVLVMYAGCIVEESPVRDLYENPRHPYTLGLLGSLPRLDAERPEKLLSIEGLPPDLIDYPKGCPFYARCNYRIDICAHEMAPLKTVGVGHKAACHVDISVAQPTTEHPYEVV